MSNVNPTQVQQLQSAAGGTETRLSLLGPLAVTIGGRPVTIASRKARALLAYLVLRAGIDIPRGVLTGLLWGERGESQARASLRQTLSELKAALADADSRLIVASKEAVRWMPDSAWIDIRELEMKSAADDEAILRGAADLIGGDLLEGFSLDEPPFEQWLAVERERFRRLGGSIYLNLMQRAENSGDLEEALTFGLRLLALDPLQEQVHRALMRIYAAQGRHDAALAQYDRCRRELEAELGAGPEAETEHLARAIRTARRSGPARPEKRAPPALPDKPSLVVLPFINLTSDREQDFFADGITEDLIGALSRIRELFVISRNSSFVYKGVSARTEDVARELGVRFVLNGSIRVAGGRLRATAQLVDGLSGSQVWGERYDRELKDVFAVQDDITRSIAVALQVKLTYGEAARLWEGQTQNLRAWERMVLARDLFLRFMPADNSDARRLLEEAVRIDPGYTGAMALIGLTHWWDARFNIAADKEQALQLAEEQVARVLKLEPELGSAYMLRGGIAFLRDQHDEAIRHCEKAVELTPSDAHTIAFLGVVLIFAGEAAKAVSVLKSAMRLAPHYPSWYTYNLAKAHLWLGNLTEARQGAEAYLALEPDEPFAYTNLATVLAFEGRDTEAAAVITALKLRFPSFGIANMLLSQRYRDRASLARVVAALRAAGLPG